MKHLFRFLEEIEDTKSTLGFKRHEECFFRGQAETTWDLQPTLFRGVDVSSNSFCDDLYDIESALFFTFQARARDLHSQKLSGWDLLFFMRHHGVATRLLDWTEVLAVALFFAVDGWKEETNAKPCVWLLNPYSLNEERDSWNKRDLVAPQYLGCGIQKQHDYEYFVVRRSQFEFGWRLPVALYPAHHSARLHAQQGYFTIHGDDARALQILASKHLRKIDIAVDAIPEIQRYLTLSGTTVHRLFPDLDGLARYLNKTYLQLSQ